MIKGDRLVFNLFAQKVVPQCDMLRALVVYRILAERNSTLIIVEKGYWRWMVKSQVGKEQFEPDGLASSVSRGHVLCLCCR